LSGFTIGVTADRRAGELIALLVGLGADCLHGPVITSHPNGSHDAAERLVRATVDGRVDAVTFTTRRDVDNFFEIAARTGTYDSMIEALEADVVVACIGPTCATGVTEVGLRHPLVPVRRHLAAMVQSLADHFHDRANVIDLAGTSVRLQGRLAVVDGRAEAWLTDRERAILDALTERPGVVLSKRDLHRRVWHGVESDEHVVEVTVARLRRRLGPAAAGIETVVRRGYRATAS
jgi:uroporphyrinogen-III synthase